MKLGEDYSQLLKFDCNIRKAAQVQSLPQENLTSTQEKSSDPPVAPLLSDAKEGVDSEVQVTFPSPPRSPPSPTSPTSPPSPVSPASPASPTSDTLPDAECPAGLSQSQASAREPEERLQMDARQKKRREAEEEEEEGVAATSSAVMLTDASLKTTSNYAYAR